MIYTVLSNFNFVAKFTEKVLNKDFLNAVRGGVTVLWKYFIKNGIFWTMASLNYPSPPQFDRGKFCLNLLKSYILKGELYWQHVTAIFLWIFHQIWGFEHKNNQVCTVLRDNIANFPPIMFNHCVYILDYQMEIFYFLKLKRKYVILWQIHCICFAFRIKTFMTEIIYLTV